MSDSTASLRRSSRARAAKQATHDSTSDEEDHSPEPSRKRPRKRAKTSGGKPASTRSTRQGRKRKTLSKLPEMPLDILIEVCMAFTRVDCILYVDAIPQIFGHLDPRDVLQLARTTKPLRNMLMHRSATSVWKHARENVPDLPDIPPDLAEPQYANLLFDPFCHVSIYHKFTCSSHSTLHPQFCVTSKTQNVVWAYRLRSCKKCFDKQSVSTTIIRLRLY